MFKLKFDNSSFQSLREFQNKLRYLKTKIRVINKEFIEESIREIINNANMYLQNSSDYQGTTDIESSWNSEIEYSGYTSISYRIENNSPFSALVEFGTGLVGGQHQHEMAKITGYEYGKKKWTFIRDLYSNEWVVSPTYTKNDVKENPERFLMIENFAGYRGKSYLFNALFDYFDLNGYIEIYERIWSKYIK